MAAGLAALILQARPDLTWRDMQHVFVHSAKQWEPIDSSWSINGAGFHYHHKFGFGLLDADAAVTTARDWTLVPPEIVKFILTSPPF